MMIQYTIKLLYSKFFLIYDIIIMYMAKEQVGGVLLVV